MKYNKEQLVNMLVDDEKQYYEMSNEEWQMIENEYKAGLDKLEINGSNKFVVVGCDDGDVIYDFGLGKKVVVDGQGCFRRMFWYEQA